eukprot:g10492.t1 g10492   contig4:1971782-1973131(-)
MVQSMDAADGVGSITSCNSQNDSDTIVISDTSIICLSPPTHDMNLSSKRRTNSNNINMMHVLTTLLLLSITSTTVNAGKENDPLVCSCSPREFYFKLALSATCPSLPPPFPPNDVFGAGVNDYTCSIGPEPIPDEDSKQAAVVGEDVRRRRLQEEEARQIEFGQVSPSDDWIVPEIIDPEPVVIDSIQFLEVDTLFNVINQDPAYVRGQNFVNGDIFNYTSISDTAWARNEKFPGGINMVLRGKNAAGERVRNVFTVTYTNECGVPTFDVGDAIGWVVIDSFIPASDESCGARSSFPTPAGGPPADEPTREPSSFSYDYFDSLKSGKSHKTGKANKAGKLMKSKATGQYEGSGKAPKKRVSEPVRGLRVDAVLAVMDLDHDADVSRNTMTKKTTSRQTNGRARGQQSKQLR